MSTTDPERRSFNLLTREEGMEVAATSVTSADFRTTFFLAMAEAATRHELFSTNDAWDILESRGFTRTGHAQAAGTVGPSGQSIGLWSSTSQTELNKSGNLHSTDNQVRVYRSLIVGRPLEEVAPAIMRKAASLADARAKRSRLRADEKSLVAKVRVAANTSADQIVVTTAGLRELLGIIERLS